VIFGETVVVKNLYLKRNYIIHIDIKYFRKHEHITISNIRSPTSCKIPDTFSYKEDRGFFILLRFSLY